MPDYKKKHVNKIFNTTPKRKVKKQNITFESEDIKMSPHNPIKRKPQSEKDLRVVKGKKLENKRKAKVFLSFFTIILIVIVILELILPVGIVENIQNVTSIIGSGEYPQEFDSTDTKNTVSRGLYYYVLTDTRLNAFSNSGKKIFSLPHGFENPILKTSKTRAMVFNQGGNEAIIYNLTGIKSTIKPEKDIITANISDSGTYAIVTQSDTYASAVTVYNKYNKLVYEWYSAEDTVNNIAISPNGKKIAVSTFNATSGQYTSKISILNFKSANPEFSESYTDTIIFNVDSFHSSGFSILTKNGYEFIKWSKYEKAEYKSEYNLAYFRAGSGGMVAVFNRESDKTDNKVVTFLNNGKQKSEFTFKGIISDIEVSKGHIYCISETSVYLLSNEGKILRNAECGFGVVRLSVIGTNLVAAITDNKIEKINLEQEK